MKLTFERIGIPLILMSIFYFFYIKLLLIQTYNLDISGHEQFFVFYIKTYLTNNKLYFNNFEFPYAENLYTPLYFYTNKIILFFYQITHEIDVRTIYLTGRTLSYILVILQSLIIYLIGKQLKLSTFYALLAVVLYDFNLPLFSFAIRPDSLKDTLFIFHIYFTIKFLRNNKIHFLFLSCLLATLSIYAKQDIAIFIFFYSFVILYWKGIKYWVLYLLVIFLISSLALLYLEFNTNHFFLENIINANIEFSFAFWNRWIIQVKNYFLNTWYCWITIFISLKYRDKNYNTLFAVNIATLILVLITTIKFGAADNYYTNLYLSTFITYIYSIKCILEKNNSLYSKVLVYALLFFLIHSLPIPKNYTNEENKIYKEEFSKINETSNYLLEKFPNQRFLILDQSYLIFIPYGHIFAGFGRIYFQFLYAKYKFNSDEVLFISKNYIVHEVNVLFENVDLLILKNNDREQLIYDKYYKKKYTLKEQYMNYMIYRKIN